MAKYRRKRRMSRPSMLAPFKSAFKTKSGKAGMLMGAILLGLSTAWGGGLSVVGKLQEFGNKIKGNG